MNKVNEFETATDTVRTGRKERFSRDANKDFKYRNIDDLMNDLPAIGKMISAHKEKHIPRLETLQSYYEGSNTNILRNRRRREEHLADNRAVHNFAEYVSGFIQGYLVGIPIKTTYDDEKVNEQLKEINRINDADEHNSELVLDQSIFGRAYELMYRSQSDEIRFSVSDVFETFVIYDETVEMNPLAGVRYIYNDYSEKETVYIYTNKKMLSYDLGDDYSLTFINEEAHSFNGIPVNEYTNNRFKRGDFEKVLSLIDLYDEAQSDTSNYMTDFNDAMLVITGDLEIDEQQAKTMKDFNLLMLQTRKNADGRAQNASADYIYKKYDVAGTEKYKDRVKNDIHMFTYTPNMDDESFAGAQSGEALKYKLFGLEQKRATKERLFIKSLRKRYDLINNILTTASEGSFNVSDIDIIFTPNLPKSLNEEIEAFTKLGGRLSEQTTLGLLSIVKNPLEEIELIESENELSKEQYGFLTDKQVKDRKEQDEDEDTEKKSDN